MLSIDISVLLQDGTVNIHTVRKGLFMQSLQLPKEFSSSQLTAKEIQIASLGHIIVYTEETSTTSSQVPVLAILSCCNVI